jgi:hypothetical protein
MAKGSKLLRVGAGRRTTYPLILCQLVLLIALASSALAQDGSRAAADAAMAAQQLKTHLDGIAQAGGRPDYDRPPASQLVKGIFDADALAKLPISRGDKPWLTEWGAAAAAALGAITEFGLQPGQSTGEPRVQQLRQNISTDAYGRGLAFLLRIQGRLIAETEQFANLRDPAIDVVRERTAKIINEALVAVPLAPPSNGQMIAAALRDTDGAWIAFLSPYLRGEVLARLTKARAETRDRATNENLDAISSDLLANATR